MTTPTTEAGKRLLAAMPYHTASEKDLWARLIAAIEDEARDQAVTGRIERAVAAERARIAEAARWLPEEVGWVELNAVLALVGESDR